MRDFSQELLDHTMEQLYLDKDRHTLATCSLVSRSLRSSAQRWLLYSLKISASSSKFNFVTFLEFITEFSRFASFVQELQLEGRNGSDLDFRKLYAILAGTPHLKSLRLRDLSLSGWPRSVVLLNPLDHLEVDKIGYGDGSCSLPHLLNCLRGLFHDVKELTLSSCDNRFIHTSVTPTPYLHLRKLVLLNPNAELLDFVYRTVASCNSLDVAVPPVPLNCKFMHTIGQTLHELHIRSGFLYASHLHLGVCTSLREVYIHSEDHDDLLFWVKRAELLKRLPSTIRELTLEFKIGTWDASASSLRQHGSLFARFIHLERLLFVPRLSEDMLDPEDYAIHKENTNQQFRLALPELHAKGVLQECLMPSGPCVRLIPSIMTIFHRVQDDLSTLLRGYL